MTYVTIPASVVTIGDNAFSNCHFDDMYCYIETPIGANNIFNGTDLSSSTLHVPAASLDAYKATKPWSQFGNIVALTELELSVQGTLDGGTTETVRYTLDGKRIIQPRRGLNIIRYSNGTTRKVMVK